MEFLRSPLECAATAPAQRRCVARNLRIVLEQVRLRITCCWGLPVPTKPYYPLIAYVTEQGKVIFEARYVDVPFYSNLNREHTQVKCFVYLF